MSEFPKPEFPELRVSELKDGLERLTELIKEHLDADSALPDISALISAAYATQDPALKQAVRAIRDERSFRRMIAKEVERFGRRVSQRDTALPGSLTTKEVNKVLEALSQAHRYIEGLDINDNDLIDAFEAEDLVGLNGLAGELSKAMLEIGGKLRRYRDSLEAWNASIVDAIESLEKRERAIEFIDSLADFHAETPQGANALRISLREEMTHNGGEVDYWEIRRRLEEAESSFGSGAPKWLLNAFSFIGADRANPTKKGHLSDAEIRRLIRARDLGEFCKEHEAKVLENIRALPNVNTWSDFVAGKDIPNLEQRFDPEFHPPKR
ncbi:MAG: hypothetical protein H6713_02360 [Myxococcales bacterium]|nr:hypothetical protein [Myxococcales bacterium]MCB9748830.1 hypothetical protein [Myxococcales bacterium]